MRQEDWSQKLHVVGIVLTGIVLLAVGLIIGLEFPKSVAKRSVVDVCITDESHPYFDEWRRNRLYTVTNKLYFWDVNNLQDVISSAHNPTVAVRGPFLFDEEKTKENVHFQDGMITFLPTVLQHMDAERTLLACPDCDVNAKVTHFHPDLLALASGLNSSESLRKMADKVLVQLTLWKQQCGPLLWDFLSGDLSLLPALVPDRVSAASLASSLNELSLSHWVQLNDSDFKRPAVNERILRNSSFTRILYESLLSSADRLTFSDAPASSSDGSGSSALSSQRLSLGEKMDLLTEKLYSTLDARDQLLVSLQRDLCPQDEGPAAPCLDLSSLDGETRKAVVYSVAAFVLHLQIQASLNVTRVPLLEQTLAALLRNLDFSMQPATPCFRAGTTSPVRLCSCIPRVEDNMKFRALEGYCQATDGFTDNVPPSKRLTSCHTIPVNDTPANYTFYVSELSTTARFSYDRPVSYANKYPLHALKMAPQDRLRLESADPTCLLGQPFKVTSSLRPLGLESPMPSLDTSPAEIWIEPMTGRVWRKVVRFQVSVNLDLIADKANMQLPPALLGRSLPLFFVEKTTELSPKGIDIHQDRTSSIMFTSCAGMIGFISASGVVIVAGVVCLYVSIKSDGAPPKLPTTTARGENEASDGRPQLEARRSRTDLYTHRALRLSMVK